MNVPIQGPTKQVPGGEASTIVIVDPLRGGAVIVETIVFNDDGTTSRPVRTVLGLSEIQAEHIEEINRRGGN